MRAARLFLVAELPTFPGDEANPPPGATVLDGAVRDEENGRLIFDVETWRSASGAVLPGPRARLLLPLGRIACAVDRD